MTSTNVLCDGKSLCYHISGKGSAIVFIHGYLETKELWEEIIPFFATQYTVICPDLPGQGNSEPHQDQSMESMAQSISALMDHLKIEKISLFGHSMGGYVSLAFAELFPDKLNALGLLHSHPFSDSDVKKKQRLQEIELVKKGKRELIIRNSVPNYFAPDFSETHEPAIEKAVKMALTTTDEGMISCISAMGKRKDRFQIFKNVAKPTLWAAGRKDGLFPCAKAIEASQELPGIYFHILENSGHVGMTEEVDETRKIISGFLKTNSI